LATASGRETGPVVMALLSMSNMAGAIPFVGGGVLLVVLVLLGYRLLLKALTLRKAAPFHLEDAQLAWIPGAAVDGAGREYIVTVARRDVVASYERACAAAGVYAGLVDLASFNLMNTVLATSPAAAGDWLLVHVGDDYATLAVVRGQDLVFFRNRSEGGVEELTDLVHQTAMYHEDRLGGGGFSRVVIAGAARRGADEAELMRRRLEDRLQSKVEPIDFRTAVPIRDRIAASPDLLDSLAPGLGILLRERVA